ncbi:MAG: hypothetical protein OXI88_18715 [Gammaproteobacteria bacterium]|nr:hypothetical protein [Gammaproteobacteria bacterium]
MGTPLPDADHVARYCKPTAVQDGIPLPEAFIPRNREEYISVNWLEYFSGTRNKSEQLKRIRSDIQESGSLRLAASGKFAVLNVGKTKERILNALRVSLTIEHWPLDNNPSHGGIRYDRNIELDNQIPFELSRLVSRKDIFAARNIS